MVEYKKESDRPKAVYARLRVCGEILLSSEQVNVITSLRKYAKADGLAIIQSRSPQGKHYPITVGLVCPEDPTWLVRPDNTTGGA